MKSNKGDHSIIMDSSSLSVCSQKSEEPTKPLAETEICKQYLKTPLFGSDDKEELRYPDSLLVLKRVGAWKFPGGLVTIAGPLSQSFWVSRFGDGPEYLHFLQVPGGTEAADWELHFENHLARKTSACFLVIDQSALKFFLNNKSLQYKNEVSEHALSTLNL